MATLITSPWSNGRRFTVVSDDISGVEQAKLLASDGANSFLFGWSVSISDDGNVSVIGSLNSGASGSKTGCAYIFRRQNGVWNQEAKLVAGDAEANDNFGYTVAISGDGATVTVASINDDDSGTNLGSVYVFAKIGSSWTQQSKLTPDSTAAPSSYGISLSLSSDGSTLAVGRHLEDVPTTDAGAVYIYVRSGGVWSQQIKLTVMDGVLHFGRAVSLSNSGDDLAVGAHGVSGDNGCVYVFTRSGVSWTQQSRIVANDGVAGDSLGYSVSISGDGNTLITGSPGSDSKASNAGAAYVFTRSGSAWTQQAKLLLADGASSDSFGNSVSISDNGVFCAVGAYLNSGKGVNSGAVALFKRDVGGVWTQTSKLMASDGMIGDRFGCSVSISGDGKSCVAGACYNSNPRGTSAGAAYVFI